MKKMTLTLVVLLMATIGYQHGAYAHGTKKHHYQHRLDHNNSITLAQGPMRVEFGKVKHKGRGHCFPAKMKVWLNGNLTKVQITVCKKKRGWIASPVHIDIGRGGAVGMKKQRPRRGHVRNGRGHWNHLQDNSVGHMVHNPWRPRW